MILLVVKEQFPNSSFRIGCSSLLGGVDMAGLPVFVLAFAPTSFSSEIRNSKPSTFLFFGASEKKTKTAN